MNWHTRFTQQATWTQELRQYLYTRAGLSDARRVLDVGCGPGALLDELAAHVPLVYGIDQDCTQLNLAMRRDIGFTCADAHQLPYPNHTFDITLCHFVLLWVTDPDQVVREMNRVTRPGGCVLALAEPDYGGRIDYPDELAILGELQCASLREQGADPFRGRKLATIFQQAGLREIETGVMGGHWTAGQPAMDDWESEWQVFAHDLKQMPDSLSASGIAKLYEIERQARKGGRRVLFVPTFWAWGKKAKDKPV